VTIFNASQFIALAIQEEDVAHWRKLQLAAKLRKNPMKDFLTWSEEEKETIHKIEVRSAEQFHPKK